MPPVRAPRGNFLQDISTAGGGLISGVLERQQREREEARQAALDADKFQNSSISRALDEARIGLAGTQEAESTARAGLIGAQQTEIGQKPIRVAEADAALRENRGQTARAILATLKDFTPEQKQSFETHYVETGEWPPGTDFTPPSANPAEARQKEEGQIENLRGIVQRNLMFLSSAEDIAGTSSESLIQKGDEEVERIQTANLNLPRGAIERMVFEEVGKALKILDQRKNAASRGGVPFAGQNVEFDPEAIIKSGGVPRNECWNRQPA